MNSSVIENVGISYLNIFLSKTKYILPIINRMEKYPMWDGELLLYKSDKKINSDLICRVPVQVKSEETSKPDIIKSNTAKYSVDKNCLIRYADDGGVLFIKIVYDVNGNHKIYMNLLLKADIIELINKSKPNSKTKTINIPSINNAEEVVTYCRNYNIHSKLQAQMPQNLNINLIKEQFKIVSYSHINDIRDLVTKDQYAYAKFNYNMHAFIGKFKNQMLAGVIKIDVGTKDKRYYKELTDVITANDRYFEIGKYLRIYSDQIMIANDLKDDNIENTIKDLEFVLDVLENRNFKIGDKIVYLNFDSDDIVFNRIKILKEQIVYFKNALDVILMLNLDVSKANVNSLINDEAELCAIRDIINGKKITFHDKNADKFVCSVDVLNQKYLIYFVKNHDGTYSGYDYLNNDIILNYLIIHETMDVQLSRYYNLKADILLNSNIKKNKVVEEIIKSTKNEYTIQWITILLLEFIKCYDLSENIEFLSIAEDINKAIMNEPLYNIDYYKINKYQMLKRKKGLSKQDKMEIAKIKVESKEKYIICSCCLLCDQYEEFEVHFNKLSSNEMETYRSWAIYYFYETHLKRMN